MNRTTILSLMLFCCCTSFPLLAQQTKAELQQQQAQLQAEIRSLNKELSSINKNKRHALNEYLLVERKLHKREQLIKTITYNLQFLDKNLVESQKELTQLRERLDTLQSLYAQDVVFIYKKRNSYNYLSFLFSSTNFNDAIKRLVYLRTYRLYRENQIATIKQTQQLVQSKMNDLLNIKNDKRSTLDYQTAQVVALRADKQTKNKVVEQFKSQAEDIRTQLKGRDAARKKLQQALNLAIKRAKNEALKARREELKRIAAAKAIAAKNRTKKESPEMGTETNVASVSDADVKLSKNFVQNKGRLPWPVGEGDVTGEFGVHALPGGVGLKVQNDGIIIKTTVGAPVRAVAEGRVLTIFDLGEYKAVVIQHGTYYTVYNKLFTTNVSKGQLVKMGTMVGKASVNTNGDAEIEFQIEDANQRYQNPRNWLAPKKE